MAVHNGHSGFSIQRWVAPLALGLVGLLAQACTQGQITTGSTTEALSQSTSSSSSGSTSSSSSSSSGSTTSSSSSSSSGTTGVSNSGIEGTIWTSPCQTGSVEPVNPAAPANFCNPTINPTNYYNANDCQAFNIVVSEQFTNTGIAGQGTFTLIETRYADTVCSTPVEQQVFTGAYTLSTSTATSGAWNVNYTSEQSSITLFNSDPSEGNPVTDYNAIDACGISTWTAGTATSVVGTSCSTQATLYNTAEVVNGTLLMADYSATYPGTSAATRPTDLTDAGDYVTFY